MKRRGTSGDPVVAVVLAAGPARRFGTQKLLARIRGRPMIHRTVESVRESGVDRVVVVLGADAASVRGALDGLTVDFVTNDEYLLGQGRSIAAGIGALSGDVAAAIIVLGDQPGVSPALIDELVRCFRTTTASIVVPDFDGVRSPPVLFGRDVFPELVVLDADVGAASVVDRLPERVRTVKVGGPVPRDIDTREDWRAFLEQSQDHTTAG